MSQRHASALVSVMFGLLLSFLLHLQGTAMKHFTRLLVNLTTLMAVVLLFLEKALDEHIRLDKETAALEKEKEASSPEATEGDAVCMHWRLQGSPPVEVSHASSRALLAELAPVAAAVALDVVEDFLSQLHDSHGAAVPAATEVEAVKYALATSGQPARGGLTRLITRAAGEACFCAAADALNFVEDFLSQLTIFVGSICPCSNRGRRMKFALATSRQPAVEVSHASSRVLLAVEAPRQAARGGLTRLITRAALSLLLLQLLLLWLLSRTSFSQLYDSCWKHLSLQRQDRSSEVCSGDF